MEIKILKKFVLENIERFCDTHGVDAIETICFGECDYGADFEIHFIGGNYEGYSYKRNVIPMIYGI